MNGKYNIGSFLNFCKNVGRGTVLGSKDIVLTVIYLFIL